MPRTTLLRERDVDGQVLMRQDETQRIAVQRSENAGNG